MESSNNFDVLEQFLRRVGKGQENVIEIIKEVLQDGSEKVTMALQNRQLQPEQKPHPVRMESPAREHKFHDVMGFVKYLQKYASEDTVVFGDLASLKFSAILNDRAKNGFEIITFRPGLYPVYAAWENVLDKEIKLEEFVNFLISHRRSISEPDGKELVFTLSQVKASTHITLNKGRGNHAINGLMCETSIQGQNKSEPVELPEIIVLQTPIFVNTEEKRIEVDMVLSARGQDIFVLATSSDVLLAKLEAFDKMAAVIGENEKFILTSGNPDYGSWAYIS